MLVIQIQWDVKNVVKYTWLPIDYILLLQIHELHEKADLVHI